MSEASEKVDIFCLAGNKSKFGIANNVSIHDFYFDETTGNYLRKAVLFSNKIFQCMDAVPQEGMAQFRDIWSGLGMINRPGIKTIFEVNALTSIELPEKYPLLTSKLIEEIRNIEKKCLESCDYIVTPSQITKKYLREEFKINENKITVIPNGGDIILTKESKNIELPDQYIVYFGALQPWQGIDVLIKSLQYLKDYTDLKLIICSSVKEKFSKNLKKLAKIVGVDERLMFYNELDKTELLYILSRAKASIAPLKFGKRNITQGCCPIKVLETMAAKTPLIAAEIPVIKELAQENAYYFWPEDELDLSRCIRYVLDNENSAKQKASKAYQLFLENYTWKHHKDKLNQVYYNLIETKND
jgi:glycosyltransferase involved in cell wall biosynthesis